MLVAIERGQARSVLERCGHDGSLVQVFDDERESVAHAAERKLDPRLSTLEFPLQPKTGGHHHSRAVATKPEAFDLASGKSLRMLAIPSFRYLQC